MWSSKFFLLAISLAIHQDVTGLEMFLDLDVKVLPGHQSTCGVLHCREEGEEPRLSSITEITVFKSIPGAGGRSRRTVANVSKRQPNVSAFWNDIKVDGTWSKQRAELKLYLVERDDCKLAEFSCEVRIIDGFEEERIGYAQWGKTNAGPAHPQSQPETVCSSPSADLLQLSALIQQTSSANQLQSRLEDKIRSLENRLEDKIGALNKPPVRHAEGFANANAQERIEQSLAVLDALEDRLLGVVDKMAKAAMKNTSEDETNLTQHTSCERREGRYRIVIPGQGEVPYLCDIHTEGGGWIVIQRRSTGNVDFYKNWSAYKKGFGSLADDFWLGNDKIHALTSQGPYELLVSLTYGNTSAFAHYQTFSIGDEANKYILHLGKYDGSAGDSLSGHKNKSFSTYDRDNDMHNSSNCAYVYHGAWWYGKCHTSNLNGEWGALDNKGPRWYHLTRTDPVTFSEMKIRRLY